MQLLMKTSVCLDVWILWRSTITSSGLASVWSRICCRNFSNVSAVAVPEWTLECIAPEGQLVQPEPRPRWLNNGRLAPAAPRGAVVVGTHAGLVGPEQQGSLRLRPLGEGGVGFFDPSPHRVGVLLVSPELRALRGDAEASQDPMHRRQGQLDLELVEDPWPDNLQRPAGELELELAGRFVPQSFEDHLQLAMGEAGRASRLGLLSESLESAAGIKPKPEANQAAAGLYFQPTYSPPANPVELLWSLVQRRVSREMSKTKAQLRANLEAACQFLLGSSEQAQAFFQESDCKYIFPRF